MRETSDTLMLSEGRVFTIFHEKALLELSKMFAKSNNVLLTNRLAELKKTFSCDLCDNGRNMDSPPNPKIILLVIRVDSNRREPSKATKTVKGSSLVTRNIVATCDLHRVTFTVCLEKVQRMNSGYCITLLLCLYGETAKKNGPKLRRKKYCFTKTMHLVSQVDHNNGKIA